MKLRLKRVSILAVAFAYIFSYSIEVGAMDVQFYSSNNILFYNPNERPCVAGELVLSGNDNREKIYNFLVSKGLNEQQAVGVVGNIKKESGYSPTRHEDSHSNFESGGYGIAQWTGGRRTALVEYLERNHHNMMDAYYNDAYGGAVRAEDGYIPRNSETGTLMPLADNDILLLAELNFLFDETTSRKISSSTASKTSASQGENEWEALSRATSVADATKIWLYNFEIPANIDQEAITRTQDAEQILEELRASPAVTASTSTCLDDTSGDVAALQATIKKYAWPVYTAGKTDLMPEYKKAVDTAFAAGSYVGGLRFRGVDCGGFITRVMIDSGYEPSYNATNSNTVGQRIWLDENWDVIGTGSTIDTADLKPGDVAIQPGHTFMFAGTDIEGFGTMSSWKGVASASLDNRAPMAGLENMTEASLTWYRKGAAHTHE